MKKSNIEDAIKEIRGAFKTGIRGKNLDFIKKSMAVKYNESEDVIDSLMRVIWEEEYIGEEITDSEWEEFNNDN